MKRTLIALSVLGSTFLPNVVYAGIWDEHAAGQYGQYVTTAQEDSNYLQEFHREMAAQGFYNLNRIDDEAIGLGKNYCGFQYLNQVKVGRSYLETLKLRVSRDEAKNNELEPRYREIFSAITPSVIKAAEASMCPELVKE